MNYGKADEQYKLECSARFLLTKPLERRREMLQRMSRIHGSEFIEKLKMIIKSEFEKAKEK